MEGANRQIGDGRCCQIGAADAVTDPCAIGEALITACEQTGDPVLLEARDRLLTWALRDAPRNKGGIVYHLTSAREMWVDSFYMLPPFLARAGYYEEALKQIDGYWRLLWNPENGMLSHRWDDEKQRFIRKAAWGVGNGWAAAGMARVIELLPPGYAAARQALIEKVRALLAAILPYQRGDGMFHDVIDDSATFAEVNLGQMLAYTIYRGIKAGWLSEECLAYAERACAAARKSVDGYGLVRNVCGAPHFDRPGVAPEGQAFYILMETARNDLLGEREINI